MLRFSFFLLLLLLNLLGTAHLLVAASDAVQPSKDNNSCPDDTRWLVITKKACEKAAKEQKGVNKFFGTENNAFWPTGCYFCKKNVSGCEKGTWWNKHGAGTAKKQTKRLCALPTWEGCTKGGCEEPTDDDDDDDDDDDNTDTTITTLFVGDSDIEYWKKTDTLYPPSKNVGVGGWTAKKVSKKIDQFLADDPPTAWVVLVCGENDFGEGESVGKTFKSFKKIVKEVLKTTQARVLYLGTKPEPGTTDLHPNYRKYDKKIRNYAKELNNDRDDDTLLPPLVMIDTYPQFMAMENPASLYKKDDLHLSNSGYAYWNEWTTYVFNNADTQCQVYQNNVCTQE